MRVGRLLPSLLSSSSSTTTTTKLVALRAPAAPAASRLHLATATGRERTTTTSFAAAATAPVGRSVSPLRINNNNRLVRMASSASPSDAPAAAAASVDWASLGLTPNPGEDVAVLGGGCFWCIEAAFNGMKGVSSAISGYAGGHVERPTYEEVCGKKTGHAEVVAVYFDASVVDYSTILRVFYALHDPTTPDQQGNDVGPQYRSALYTVGEAQRAAAEQVMREVAEAKIWGDRPLTTELAPLRPGAPRFWAAEKVHQRYFEHSPENPYCQFVVAPKVSKFRSKFAHLLK